MAEKERIVVKLFSVEISQSAEQDIQKIEEYIMEETDYNSDVFLQEVNGAIKLIQENPLMFPEIESFLEDSDTVFRKTRLRIGYLVFYIVYENIQHVTIEHIVHEKSDWTNKI